MKIKTIVRSLIIAGVLLSQISCNNEKAAGETDPYDQKVKMERVAGKADTRTFLDFRFNDSKTRVFRRLDSLFEAKVLDGIEDGYYTYTVNTGEKRLNKIKCLIIPNFIDDRLYKINLLARDDGSIAQSMDIVLPTLQMLWMEKYGAPDKTVDLSSYKKYEWINDGQSIEIYPNVEGAMVCFTNLKLQQLLTRTDSLKAAKDKEKTMKDL